MAALPDAAIETADIPEAAAENRIDARHGGLYRPVKQPVTIRLDADALAWFKEHAPSGTYQTEINRVPRHHAVEGEKHVERQSSLD